jgi:hypothetical protein
MVPIQKQKQSWIWQQYQDNELIARSQYSQYQESGTGACRRYNYSFTLQNPTTPSQNMILKCRESSLEPAFAIASSIFYLACWDKTHIQEVQL